MSTHHESEQLSPNAIFARLRDICAKLYPTEQDARVIVNAFSARAETNWHNIFAEAIDQNQFDALLERVRSDYPTHQPFQDVLNDYAQFTAAGGQFDMPAQLPAGFDPHDVHGLANPYLGLDPFRYKDRDIYAGRDAKIDEAMAKLTTPGQEQAVLFVTRASGSGKSSFVQAGLLPRLEAHYAQRHCVEQVIKIVFGFGQIAVAIGDGGNFCNRSAQSYLSPQRPAARPA